MLAATNYALDTEIETNGLTEDYNTLAGKILINLQKAERDIPLGELADNLQKNLGEIEDAVKRMHQESKVCVFSGIEEYEQPLQQLPRKLKEGMYIGVDYSPY